MTLSSAEFILVLVAVGIATSLVTQPAHGAVQLPELVMRTGIETTMVFGPDLTSEWPIPPIYGTANVSSPTNTPGSRLRANTWLYIHPITGNTTLYLYSGTSGSDSSLTLLASYQDMWRFDFGTKEWTWIAGPTTSNSTGENRASGTPGYRADSITWQMGTRLLLYSGLINLSASDTETWEYDTETYSWTFIHGSSVPEAPDCSTHTPGGRVNGAVWRVPIAPDPVLNNNTYGDTDVYLYGGPVIYSPPPALWSNMWKLDKASLQFECVQNYPSSAFTVAAPYRNFSTAYPAAGTFPGISNFDFVVPTPWVYDSDTLAISVGTPSSYPGLPYLVYSISANRWAPMTRAAVEAAPPRITLYSPYFPLSTPNEGYPSRVLYAWVDRTIYPDGRPIAIAVNDFGPASTPSATTWGNVWGYDYDNDVWTWFGGNQFVVDDPVFFAPPDIPLTTNNIGTRFGAMFGSTYGLPYELPSGTTPPLTVIGHGQIYPISSYRADVLLYRSNPDPTPAVLPPATATPVYGTVKLGWIGGTNSTNATAVGVYPANPGEEGIPPTRSLAQTWTYTPADGSPSILYMFGGRRTSPTPALYSDMWKFDTGDETWRWVGGAQGPQLPSPCCASPTWPGPVYSAATWRIDDRLYMYGGNNDTAELAYQTTTAVWSFNVTSELWTLVAGSGASVPSCGGNTPGSRYATSVWGIPSTTQYGATDEVYMYGGLGDSIMGGVSRSNMWNWDKPTESWVCIQNYPSLPAQNDVAGYRNFTTAFLPTVNRPGHAMSSASWVYNSTLLVLQPYNTGTLWGYNIPLNRWARLTSTSSIETIYPPDLDARPGEGNQLFSWTDYHISLIGEPVLLTLGNSRPSPTSIPPAHFESPILMRPNLWAYSLQDDRWLFFDNGYGRYIAGPTYNRTDGSIGSRAGGAVFAGEQCPPSATGGPILQHVYVGLGGTAYSPGYQLFPTGIDQVAYNDIFVVDITPPAEPPVEPPAEPPVDPPVDPPIDPPIDPPVDLPAEPPVDPPIDPPADPPIEPPVEPPADPPTDLPIEPPADPPIEPPVDPPVEPPADPPVNPPVGPPVDPPIEPPADPPIQPPSTPPAQAPIPVPPSSGMTGFIVWIAAVGGVTLVVAAASMFIWREPVQRTDYYTEMEPIGAMATAVDPRARVRRVRHV